MSVILCTAGYDHTIRFWEALSGICSRTIQHSDSQVNRLCISPDKRLLAAAGREGVKLYDIKSTNPSPFLTFKGHTDNVTAVAFHCEGKWMVTSSEDGTVKIWDTRTATIQRNYNHGSPVNDVVIHPNQGELISSDRSGSIRVWDLGENKCTHQLVPEEDISMASVTVATDGTLLCAGNNNGNVYIWRMLQQGDITNLVPVTSFQAHATYISRVLLSPDVRYLATCSADHNARIWQVNDTVLANAAAASSASGPPPVVDQAYKAQHMHTAGGQVPGVSSYALTEEQAKRALPLHANLGAHQRWVWDCAFSADSAYLVTSSSDHYARLWEDVEKAYDKWVKKAYDGWVVEMLAEMFYAMAWEELVAQYEENRRAEERDNAMIEHALLYDSWVNSPVRKRPGVPIPKARRRL